MSTVVETNVLIFDTFEDIEFHTEATNTLDSPERWYLHEIVFHEFTWFFKSENIELSRARLKIYESHQREASHGRDLRLISSSN